MERIVVNSEVSKALTQVVKSVEIPAAYGIIISNNIEQTIRK